MIHTRHFPPGDYKAITLFPFVFYKGIPLTAREERHEAIHLWQQAVLLVIPFYLLYALFWLIGMVRHRSYYQAYKSIPFEKSAYRLEGQQQQRWWTMATDWIQRG